MKTNLLVKKMVKIITKKEIIEKKWSKIHSNPHILTTHVKQMKARSIFSFLSTFVLFAVGAKWTENDVAIVEKYDAKLAGFELKETTNRRNQAKETENAIWKVNLESIHSMRNSVRPT